MERGQKSFERANQWLPESRLEKALLLQRFEGGESALRNSVSRTPPGVKENGD